MKTMQKSLALLLAVLLLAAVFSGVTVSAIPSPCFASGQFGVTVPPVTAGSTATL